MSVKQATSCCLFFLLVMLDIPAGATTIVMPTDEQLVEKSPVIVVGTVLRSDPVDRNGGIWTETEIEVQQVLKGSTSARVIIREIGGLIDERFNIVFGSPEYAASERVLVFLWPSPRGDFQTRDLFVGKFTEKFTVDGKRLWFRPEPGDHTLLLDKSFQPLSTNGAQRDADGFERFISGRIAGDGGPSWTYLVNTPNLVENAGGRKVVGNFTLISEPTVYRWFGFEAGSTTTWRSLGNQTGYGEGGLAELRTAISVWTNYSSARIRYAFGGTSTSPAGGLAAPNGINEVIFADLTDEIDGSWNPATGGVVGRGGFNNVRTGGSWTSPFAADADHPAGTFTTTGNIVEGNLVIQDGVSPGQGISSASLAEILAHEFGHTLGFGHSADPTALMFARVTGGGASLKADDQLAARWLYPTSGGGGGGGGAGVAPTIPAAPSNLNAVVANMTQIQLTWRDNANNETSQAVYLAAGSAAFNLAGEVAADRTSATLSGLTLGQSYRVYVTAKNSAGESSGTNTAHVTTPDGTAVNASFTVSPASGTAGITSFNFLDQSTGPVVSRQWNFDDGQSASSVSVSHVYELPGSYAVSLTVRNSSNVESTTTRNVLVIAASPGVRAAFSFSPSNPSVDDTVAFTDQSTDATSWSWSFGDGTGSADRNPSKRYSIPGRYSVMLTSSNLTSSAFASREITVTAGNPVQTPVDAQFDVSNVNPVTNSAVQFTDRSTGFPTSWEWTFGDGTSSDQQSPSHTYALAGTYAVFLRVFNISSTSLRSRIVTVTPEIKSFRSLVPVTAQTPGAGDTNWRTELTLFNASEFPVNVRLEYLPDGGPDASREIAIKAGESVTYSNALLEVFGLASGAGAIFVEATNPLATPSLKVASRTFTTSSAGTYGLFVPGVVSPSGEPYLYVTGLAANSAFRTNIGLVNNSDQSIGISMTAFDAGGSPLGQSTTALEPGMFRQTGLTTLFPSTTFPTTAISLRIAASNPTALTAYASVVDNRSQDPTYMPAVPAIEAQETFIPVVGRTPGAGGTFWQSDVTLFNPGSESMIVTLRFLESGRDNGAVVGSTLTLPAGKTTVLTDVVDWLGNSSGSGALLLSVAGSVVSPIVTSRTYTTSDTGTYGQAIDPALAGQFGVDRYVVGLKSDSSYRSNLGFVNRANIAIGVHVTLLASDGKQVSTAFLEMAARSQSQMSVGALFPQADVQGLGNFIMRARTIVPSALFAYGSVVDNSTGDPVFIAGE